MLLRISKSSSVVALPMLIMSGFDKSGYDESKVLNI